MQADARRIEMVVDRNYPFGSKLKHEVKGRLPPRMALTLGPAGGKLTGVMGVMGFQDEQG